MKNIYPRFTAPANHALPQGFLTPPPVRRLILLLPMLFLAMSSLISQTTWMGIDTDWDNPSNWSAGVPGAAIDAIVPNVANDPIVNTAAVSKFVTVQSGAVLTIASGASLTIDGPPTQGLLNQGSVENSGTLNIGQTTGTGVYGIRNESIFNNNTGGQINIDRSTNTGLYNFTGGTFTNAATITIGAAASTGVYGIRNESVFNNNTGGQINIERSTNTGLYNHTGGTFTNAATYHHWGGSKCGTVRHLEQRRLQQQHGRADQY